VERAIVSRCEADVDRVLSPLITGSERHPSLSQDAIADIGALSDSGLARASGADHMSAVRRVLDLVGQVASRGIGRPGARC